METPSNLTCQKCSKHYCVTTIRPLKGCIPLSLPCKHTVCDVCVKCRLKLNEPLKCDLCQHNVEVTPEKSKELLTNENLYDMFPVNMFVLGQLTYDLSQHSNKMESLNQKNPYINLKAIIEKSGCYQKCSECKEDTSYKCVTCSQVYCDKCFTKIHSAFESLKSHAKEKIGFDNKTTPCQVHPSVDADFYCDTCKKPICMSCLVVGEKECASHKIYRFHDKNLANLDKFKEAHAQADEVFRRLTKTSVDIGNRLDAMNTSGDSESDTNEIAVSIRQHYAKLHACLQHQELEKLAVVKAMSETDRQSLERARATVEQSLTTLKGITDKINFFIENIDVKINVTDLVEEMRHVIENTAWYLHKLELPDNAPSFKMNAEVFKVLEEHLTLNGDANRGYTLLGTEDVPGELPPAPAKPVFPPEVVIMDVRMKDKNCENVNQDNKKGSPKNKNSQQNVQPQKQKRNIDYVPPPKNRQPYAFTPTARSMSGSVSSVNSLESGSTGRFFRGNHHYDDTPSILAEGSIEMAFVEHINDPSDFYVHRACLHGQLKELQNEFACAASFPKPSPQQIIEGNLYLSLSKISRKFQRCRVLTITRDSSNQIGYHVFYIDHGPSETVTINDLRVLPLSLTLLPPLALACRLADVRPLGHVWHPDDTMFMHRITSHKKMSLHVVRTPEPTIGLALECELTSLEDSVNVARALVFHERARFIHPDMMDKPMNLDLPKLYYNPDMKKNSTEEVVISCIVSPDKFFIRKKYLESQYEKLSEDLNDSYGDMKKNHNGKVYCPEVGMVVACYVNLEAGGSLQASGAWRRGVVLGRGANLRVLLSLPDSGHELSASWNCLRRLHPRFLQIKQLAVECHLSHISPANKRWSKASVQALEEYAQHKLTAYVDEPAGKGRSMGVRLYDHTDPQNEVCINEEFIKSKYAVNIGALTFALPKQPKPLQDKVPIPKPTPKPKRKPEVRILNKKEPIADQLKNSESLDVTVDRGPVKLEVKILSCQTPSQLYVSLVTQQESLMELYESLQSIYEENPPAPKQEWQPDEKCCVFDSKNRVWKRASILTSENERARVFYTDFAVVDEVPYGQVLPLLPEFQKIPNGAFKCHLRGIMPAGGSDWPGISCEHLNDLIDQYSRYFITKKGSVKDKSMPVELWVYHVTPGGALEASKGEWRLLNQNLVQQGLALPDRDANEESASEDTLSLLSSCATGTVSQWLQLRPSPEATDDTSNKKPDEFTTNVDNLTSPPDTKRIRTTFQGWLPVKPLSLMEFECVPTFVDNEGFIYLHDVNSKDILDLISVSLNFRYKNSPIENTEWQVNDPCIALYGLDNQYYRGRVVQVLDQSSCSIEFVDYGNIEFCLVENMRRELITFDIPIQALKCKLAGITLTGGNRRMQAVDYTHRIIVEKTCYVKILGQEAGVYNIDLHLKGQNVNKLLVETQFATCVNSDCEKEMASVDSDPDYIVEDESSPAPSVADCSLDRLDWNTMIEEEERRALVDSGRAYPSLAVAADADGYFDCVVEYINNVNTIHISLCDRPETELSQLKEVLDEIQTEAVRQPVMSDAYPGKPCLALFGSDGVWYRALVLHSSESQLHVLYVDFGNSGSVERLQARETRPQWVRAPPRVLRARLRGVCDVPEPEDGRVGREYSRLLMTDRLVARRVPGAGLVVELCAERGGALVYQELIDAGIIALEE